mmetsp:Transcript_97212/g.256642  ORF Transcript_97212/g.256642 Transcript_97212/m.256642 type:complete len:208 (+) Transcript_97212:258-881(+)
MEVCRLLFLQRLVAVVWGAVGDAAVEVSAAKVAVGFGHLPVSRVFWMRSLEEGVCGLNPLPAQIIVKLLIPEGVPNTRVLALVILLLPAADKAVVVADAFQILEVDVSGPLGSVRAVHGARRCAGLAFLALAGALLRQTVPLRAPVVHREALGCHRKWVLTKQVAADEVAVLLVVLVARPRAVPRPRAGALLAVVGEPDAEVHAPGG